MKTLKQASLQLQVNLDRLKATLLQLSRIGSNEDDNGICRVGFSESDLQAHRWLMGRSRLKSSPEFVKLPPSPRRNP